MIEINEEIGQALFGGSRLWQDPVLGKVMATTLYLAEGCADWNNCTFCGLPDAVRAFNDAFFDGRVMTAKEHLAYFCDNLLKMPQETRILMVFNGGSFLADVANPLPLRTAVVEAIAMHPGLDRLVIESRAPLVTQQAVEHVIAPLRKAHRSLTVRIGVETKSEKLRNQDLRKGFSGEQVLRAVEVLHGAGAEAGAYVILNPKPGMDVKAAVAETKDTFRWVFEELGCDEAYFGPTCVPEPLTRNTVLFEAWQRGEFAPATLWMTWDVLREAAENYPGRVHLLPFRDQPPFVAVPSNHVSRGIFESLEGAVGCDLEFHAMFERYRETLDVSALEPPPCNCRPEWI